MQNINLNIGSLALKNLTAKPARALCLIVVAAVLSFILFGGSIIITNLQQGLSAMTKRFGADLMVVPKGSADSAQTILLRGEPNYFYFDANIIDSIAATEGVAQVSPQFYFASLSNSECCDSSVQLISFDPATDFVVQPWISEKYHEKINDGQLVIGSRIEMRSNGTIKLYGNAYPVAAQLSASASGFDTTIFMTMNTMRSLTDDVADGKISSVLVKIEPSASSETIARIIQQQNEDAEVVVSQGIFSRISTALGGFVSYIKIFSIALWVLAVVVLAAVFSGIIHERKKEFALLRIVGAKRTRLIGIVLCESSLAALAGAAAGILIASIFIFPFANLISARLELPYLDTSFLNIVLLVVTSLVISVLTGPLASLYSALKISRAETYFTMREGE